MTKPQNPETVMVSGFSFGLRLPSGRKLRTFVLIPLLTIRELSAQLVKINIICATHDFYPKQEEAEHQAQAAQERLGDIAPKLENIEKLLRSISVIQTRSCPLPVLWKAEMPTGRKKAKPFFKKLLDLLRSVYNFSPPYWDPAYSQETDSKQAIHEAM